MVALNGEARPDVGVAGRPRAGEAESGDAAVVRVFDDLLLLAVVDALGHGKHAAVARRAAVEVLHAWEGEAPQTLILACHEALQGTRGAVMTVAIVRERELWWAGVGNVEGVVLERGARARWLVQRPGVVGWRLPAVRTDLLTLGTGSTLVLASDGILQGFEEHARSDAPPVEIAHTLLRDFGRDDDDATVLVARPGELERGRA